MPQVASGAGPMPRPACGGEPQHLDERVLNAADEVRAAVQRLETDVHAILNRYTGWAPPLPDVTKALDEPAGNLNQTLHTLEETHSRLMQIRSALIEELGINV